MKLGFIGTGKIASSVITGICRSSIKYSKIYISSRNSKIAKNLKKKFKRIYIEKDNQRIIDNCNWIFLAVTPTVGERIIKNLRFKSSQTIISFISTITIPESSGSIFFFVVFFATFFVVFFATFFVVFFFSAKS